MSELLDLANEVKEDVQYIIKEGLSDAEPWSSEFKAYTVIQGYQELLQKIVDIYDGPWSSKYIDELLRPLIDEARAAIPVEDQA